MLSKCFIASSGNLKTEHSDPNLWFPHQHPSLRTASLLRRKVASRLVESALRVVYRSIFHQATFRWYFVAGDNLHIAHKYPSSFVLLRRDHGEAHQKRWNIDESIASAGRGLRWLIVVLTAFFSVV